MVTVSGEGVNVGSLDDQVNILQELNTVHVRIAHLSSLSKYSLSSITGCH